MFTGRLIVESLRLGARLHTRKTDATTDLAPPEDRQQSQAQRPLTTEGSRYAAAAHGFHPGSRKPNVIRGASRGRRRVRHGVPIGDPHLGMRSCRPHHVRGRPHGVPLARLKTAGGCSRSGEVCERGGPIAKRARRAVVQR